jgi:hypothetical protein
MTPEPGIAPDLLRWANLPAVSGGINSPLPVRIKANLQQGCGGQPPEAPANLRKLQPCEIAKIMQFAWVN